MATYKEAMNKRNEARAVFEALELVESRMNLKGQDTSLISASIEFHKEAHEELCADFGNVCDETCGGVLEAEPSEFY